MADRLMSYHDAQRGLTRFAAMVPCPDQARPFILM
jgi:hypothetical protein